jgi:uncharacterized membrane protein
MKKTITPILLMLSLVAPIFAQKTTTKPVTNVIFAVLNDGRTLEPLAKIENGKLMQTVSGGDDGEILKAFSKTYYKPKTVYNLIFAGNIAGTVSVIKNDPTAECSTNLASATTKSTKAKLKGFVMGLATNMKPTKTFGTRRMPTPAERAAVEKLVSAEFAKNKVSAKTLRSHNLTALDVDKDGKMEFVGTYWVTTSATERALLFFIADSVRGGKLSIGFNVFRNIKKDEVMSGEINALDEGVYHELLLDILDYNNDGVAEIFTYSQGFEGASFSVYRRNEGTWEQEVETSNYHCGY